MTSMNLIQSIVARKMLTDYKNVVVVDAGGNGDYTTLSAALAGITGESDTNQFLIVVIGTVVDVTVSMRPYIHLVGFGRQVSKVICSGSFVLPTVPSVGSNRIPNHFVNLTVAASDITGSVASFVNLAGCTLDAPVLIPNLSGWRASDTFFRRTVSLTLLTVGPVLDAEGCVFGASYLYGTGPSIGENSIVCSGGTVKLSGCHVLGACSFSGTGSLESVGTVFYGSVALASTFKVLTTRFYADVTLSVQPTTSVCVGSYFGANLVGSGWTNVKFAYNAIAGSVTNVQFASGTIDGLNVKNF